MEKLTDWEKGLLEQVKEPEPKKYEFGASRISAGVVVLYGIAAAVAVLVFMWGQS